MQQQQHLLLVEHHHHHRRLRLCVGSQGQITAAGLRTCCPRIVSSNSSITMIVRMVVMVVVVEVVVGYVVAVGLVRMAAEEETIIITISMVAQEAVMDVGAVQAKVVKEVALEAVVVVLDQVVVVVVVVLPSKEEEDMAALEEEV